MYDTLLGAQAVLRRNFEDQPFVGTMLDADKAACAQRVQKALHELPSEWTLYSARDMDTDAFSALQARVGLEDDVLTNHSVALFVRQDEGAVVLANVEDHVQVRVQAQEGNLGDAAMEAKNLMRHIGEDAPFAKDVNLGWLTARPLLAGTGLQMTYRMHLPMLNMMQQIKGITQGLTKEQLFELNTSPGQTEKNPAALYHLSSMFSAYGDAEKLVQAAMNKMQELDRKEANLRDKILVRSARSTYVDQVWRAYGVLKYARRLTEQEFLSLWSKLRLGVLSGLVPVPLETVDGLRNKLSRTALQGMLESAKDDHALHFLRADIVRAELNGG